jgi:hypothetical protein
MKHLHKTKNWGKFSEPKIVHQYAGSKARADVQNTQIFYSLVYEFFVHEGRTFISPNCPLL